MLLLLAGASLGAENRIHFSARCASDPDPLDFPFELHARHLANAAAYLFAQALDIGRGGGAVVDQEIAVHLGDLGIADAKSPAARRIDQFPRLLARRVLEGGAARAGILRLRGGTRLGNGVHLAKDLGGIAGTALEQSLGED